MNEKIYAIENEVIEAVRIARGEVTDLMELALGASEHWPMYRSRILRIFGDRGLQGKIQSVLNESVNWKWHENEKTKK